MRFLLLFLVTLFSYQVATAQYFGRNKPRYHTFDFKVLETPNYEIYHYLRDRETVYRLAQWSEMWYEHHHDIFQDSIDFLNPVLFYNDHADFQQNNAISGNISPGTGGVTEAFKNRVVMPLTFTHQQTNHVLGHELVHAFQFNNVVRGDNTGLGSLANLPLWMSEGLAEYMSLGGTNSHTAMWMRDAVAHDDIPSVQDLQGRKYFPYRYGHAMWAMITGVYGDQVIEPLYQAAARRGLAVALDSILNTSAENISSAYKSALKTYYEPLIEARDEQAPGKAIITKKNSGNMNIAPVISPNGRWVVYLSEKDLITTDLFLADARTGDIEKKLVSLIDEGGVDHINYMESAGAWSPDSKQFAVVVYRQGKNAILIKDVESGKTTEVIEVPRVPAISSLTWSPDGQHIAFSGLVEGQVDLYQYNVRTGRSEQLTDDVYSEIHPCYSPDGQRIVFSTDRRSFQRETYRGMYTLDLALIDRVSLGVEVLDIFPGADNVSPVYNHNGDILFLSDRDGFRDMYRYEVTTGEVYRLTTLKTGVSGITAYSPAVTAALDRDRIIYSHYTERRYDLYRVDLDDFVPFRVNSSIVKKVGAVLPPTGLEVEEIVDSNLAQQGTYPFMDVSNFDRARYRPQFQLDYIGGGAGFGVNNNNFGNNVGLQGGIQMLFSDILGNNQLFGVASVNGDILDIGGQATYINRKNRLAYGFGLGHIPLRTGFQSFGTELIDLGGGQTVEALRRDVNILRLFNESASAFVHLPFSTTLRAEAGVSSFYQHFRQDLQKDYFLQDGLGRLQLIGQERERVETADQIRFNEFYTLTRGFGAGANAVLVGDNSYFGFTGPIAGHRFRLGIEAQRGIDDFYAALFDGRRYFFKKPWTFAIRGLSYNRFEQETNTVYPLYVGNMGFVRGYQDVFSDAQVNPEINFDRMIGSKIAMVSAEVRLPFTGPRQLALIPTSFLLSDLVVFVDAGTAFDTFGQLRDGRATNVILTDDDGNTIDLNGDGIPDRGIENVRPLLAASAGVATRVNLGGILIIEPFYARQLVSNGRWDFGFNFIPGW